MSPTGSSPTLTYLSFDSLAAGVGASQVLPYVEALAAAGLDVVVHSFEPAGHRDEHVAGRLDAVGARWVTHPFGRFGPIGGVTRVVVAARAVRGVSLVHARSDLAAAAAMLGRARRWVWDVRALWADQRIALGTLRAGSPEERVLRVIERRAAHSSSAIVTLTDAVLHELASRHGPAVVAKARVVPTCVDLARFGMTPLPPAPPARFLLSGSLNSFYDVPTMIRLAARAGAVLEVLSPEATPWDDTLGTAGAERSSARPWEVPEHLARSHVGLSVCRLDAGVSLLGAMPTKIAEFLACGRPVVVNAGLGDMDRLLAEHRCGVVLLGTADDDLDRAVDELRDLLADPDLPVRCRRLAETHFALDRGVATLMELYRSAAC